MIFRTKRGLRFDDIISDGKYAGKTVAYVVHHDIRYAKWMLEAGFPFDDRVARAISCIKIKNYNERKK